MKKVKVYTGFRCSHCDWTKALLAKKKVSFIEYNIHEDPKKREEMLSKSNGAKTVPQIFVEDFHVGGNKELQILEREGKLGNILNN